MIAYLGLILTVLIAIPLFVYGKFIHKHEYKFYLGTLIVSAILIVLILIDIRVQNITFIYEVFYSGHLSFALFTLVMLGGVFKKKSKMSIYLIRIRREMAILGFLTLLPHAFLRMSTSLNGFNSTGLIAFLVIIPLVITSLPKVRRLMHPKTWKKVHYAAYFVYVMIYIHLVFDLFITRSSFNITVKSSGYPYLILFMLYLLFKGKRVVLSMRKAA